MSHLFAGWLHHSNNFPNGFSLLGVPLFAINRVAKVCLLSSALVILIDIIGPSRIEASFKKMHERLSGFIGKHHLKQVVQELSNTVAVFLLLFRSTFKKETLEIDAAARQKVGPVFRVFGVGILAGFGWAALLGIILALISFLSMGNQTPLLSRLFSCLIIFVLTTGLFCFLITLSAFFISLVLWIVAAVFLRPAEVILKVGTGIILRIIHDKGAAHSWRSASLWLLVGSFLLDFFTS